ncbi:MAG TPA: peptidyl-prolyl cis-trans isomerase [candidate division Zixibacteria bacterium]|nr:peptidyl-prolyl cis-trans isomerase [candidate division Zixibacteria bacterium]
MKRYWSFVFLAGGILLAGAGCSKKSKTSAVVAEVGGDKITVEDITGQLSLQGRLFGSPEEELAEKQRILDSIVEARLLLREAYREKLDRDSQILAFEKLERPLFLIDALYFKEVRDKARLSNAEVLRYYRIFRNDRCFKQLLVRDERLADSLLALLKKGARFDSLAAAHTKDPVSAPKGGDIGCFGWSRKPPGALLEQTAELKRGELAGPLRMPEGFLILQCYEERPAELPDLKVFEAELRVLLEPERGLRRSAEYVAEVRKKLDFRIIDSAARFVNRMQQELSTIRVPGQPERYSIYLRTEELTKSQREMPLAVYKGGAITAGQYLETQQGSAPMTRLVLDTTERTRALLFQLVFRDAMASMAASKGLEKDAEFLKRLKQAVENQMASMYKSRIYSTVRFDTARVRTYYNAHPEEFVMPSAVHLFELNRSAREDIASLKDSIRNKAQFMAAASRLTNRVRLRPARGELGWVEQHQFPELFAAASKLKPGGIGGPVELSDGSFSLIYLEAKRPSRKLPYADVKVGLWERLWTEAGDSVFGAWMAEQKKKVKVAVYPEVLEKTIDRKYYAKLKEWQEKLKEGSG